MQIRNRKINELIERFKYNPKYKKSLWVGGISIASILVLLFVVSPVMTGYSVYKQSGEQIENLKTDLLVASTNLTSCQAFSEELFTNLNGYLDQITSCEQKVADLEVSIQTGNSELEDEITRLQDELGEKNERLTELEDENDGVIYNAANFICCIEKLDNPNINYYEISGNKIVCRETGEDDKQISCF